LLVDDQQRGEGQGHRPVCREEDDHQVGVLFAQPARGLDAFQLGRSQVDQDELWVEQVDEVERLAARTMQCRRVRNPVLPPSGR
jgi:hypothetical protein